VSNLSVSLFSNFFFFFFTTTSLPNPPSFDNQQQQEGCLDGYGTQKLHPFIPSKVPITTPPPPPTTTTTTTTLHFPNQTNQCPLLFKSPTLQTSAIENISSSSSPSLSQMCYVSLFDPQSFLSLSLSHIYIHRSLSLTYTYTNLSLSLSLSLFVREVVDKDALKLGCCVGMNANEEGKMGFK
jgi:hypothetical protein